MTDTPPVRQRFRPGSRPTAPQLQPLPPASIQHDAACQKLVDRAHRTTLSSIGGETPPKLKALEVEWKSRRRKVLEDISNTTVNSGRSGSAVTCTDEAKTEALQRREGKEKLIRGTVTTTKAGEAIRTQSTAKARVLMPGPAQTTARFHASQGAAPPTPPDTPPPPPLQLPTYRPHIPTPTPLSPSLAVSLAGTPPLHVSTVVYITPSPVTPRPSPILASPLPPTTHPVRLRPESKDTIQILLHRSIDIVMSGTGGRLVHVLSGGRAVEFLRVKDDDAPDLERRLAISESHRWSREDRRDWEAVGKAVETFKRRMPRVRLYLSLGRILITCCSPPDIILYFHIQSPVGPESRATPSLLGTAQANAMPVSGTVKVRLAYSRVSREIQVDTSSVRSEPSLPGGKIAHCVQEKLRTKRVMTLTSPDKMSAESAVEGLGLVGLDMSEWRDEEREALKRVWRLKGEWSRWDRLESG